MAGDPNGGADSHGLQRFVEAQDAHGTFAAALAELRNGRKVSHWMWFVFPQIEGLGRSSTAQHFAIADIDEARAYLAHATLGPRLVASSQALIGLVGTTAVNVFGSVDALKLHSCMTLFALAGPDEPVFRDVLDQYFGGELDHGTLSRLPAQ